MRPRARASRTQLPSCSTGCLGATRWAAGRDRPGRCESADRTRRVRRGRWAHRAAGRRRCSTDRRARVSEQRTIAIDGERISDAGPRSCSASGAKTVSFIFQTFNLFPGLTALENVQFGVDVSGRRRDHDRARATLAEVGLADRLHHFPRQLSGGEQQRVAIARALATGNRLDAGRRADRRARLPDRGSRSSSCSMRRHIAGSPCSS